MTTTTNRTADAPPTFEGRPLPDPTEPGWDQGLAFDVQTLMDRRRVLKGIGHNLPQEAPHAFAAAVIEVGGY